MLSWKKGLLKSVYMKWCLLRFYFDLKELWNCVLSIICVCTLLCSLRVCISVYLFGKIVFSLSVFPVLISSLYTFKIGIIIVYTGTRCSETLFSFFLKNYLWKLYYIKHASRNIEQSPESQTERLSLSRKI